MLLNCDVCESGTGSDGNPCGVCGGDGKIDLLDPAFGRMSLSASMQGFLWNTVFTQLADLTDKVNDVMDKCNDIMDKCNDIKEKLDET